jgi:hypothetical protein
MGSKPKPQQDYVPPPPPTPTPGDAAEGADQLVADQRRKRNTVSRSYLAGETAGAKTTGSTTPGAPAGFLSA